MNLSAIRAQFEPMREVGFADIGADYFPVGAPFANPAYHVVLQNLTDQPAIFSFLPAGQIPLEDGTDDHIVVQSEVAYVLDINTNRTNVASGYIFAQGTQVWVAAFAGAPASGEVVLSVLYGAS
jgi:hypothetical protein